MKILFIRFSSIGDIVLTTPVVKATKRCFPQSEIHYLTKETYAQLLLNNSCITKVYQINQSVSEIKSQLKVEHYNVVIDLHKNIRTLRVKQFLKVKSYTFDKLNFNKWLLVNFKLDNMPKKHIVDRYFEAVANIGVSNLNEKCDLLLKREEVVDTFADFNLQAKSYLAVSMGAQFNTKVMPDNLMIDVLSKVNYPFVLLGGVKDVEKSERIEKILNNLGANVVNKVNAYNLMQSSSIVAQSKVLLCHDTGLMHIATAFDVPIVSVWGNTVPELGMYPFYPNNPSLYSIHEVKDLNCRPCSKIGFESCPKKHFNCMSLQDVDKIITDVNRRMEE